MYEKCDFSGYVTKHNVKCADGRTILKGAFKHQDGGKVPLMWQHLHNDPSNVLGHVYLENRDDGVYGYGFFNDSEAGQNAKLLVAHGDVSSMSIWANQLKEKARNVAHGVIKEVSLVLSGANPEAFIENLNISHDDGTYEPDESEAIIYSGDYIEHGACAPSTNGSDEPKKKQELEHADPAKTKEGAIMPTGTTKEKTVQDVFDELTEEQKNVVYALIGQAIEDNMQHSDEEIEINKGGNEMKHNVFDKEDSKENALAHSDMVAILTDAKRYGSLKESVLAHGIENIDYLFPDAKTVTNTPIMIQRDMGWVQKVMAAVKNTPFSRIKSILADITEDDARAKGYIKGNQKKDEVFTLLKRTTTPQTVYKKQKIDRDDVVDIVDFDVVAWLKAEMRIMLDEELARAVLIGDGRPSASDEKIKEDNIRPIWKDDALYSIKAAVTAGANSDATAKNFIRAAIKSRKDYKGSGDPILYCTEDVLTDCLLMEDTTGRVIYDSVQKLATALRVKEIVTVPVMENQTRTVEGKVHTLLGIIVNLNDYTIGADKGGAVNMFDDFDIDYNAQKYLIETRASGALTKPYSAIALELVAAG